jgi:hypothetical protein
MASDEDKAVADELATFSQPFPSVQYGDTSVGSPTPAEPNASPEQSFLPASSPIGPDTTLLQLPTSLPPVFKTELPFLETPSTILRAVSQAQSFVVSSVDQKINETISKVAGTLGKQAGPLLKFGASAASFFGKSSDKSASPSASATKAAAGNNKTSNDYKVSLRNDGMTPPEVVEFDVMPEINENHTVGYDAVPISQHASSFQKYRGTENITWGLTVTFISRSPEEATTNLNRLYTLRGWTMPYFGVKTGASYPGKLGAPPPVLKLAGLRTLIGPVPVIITSLHWQWPRDVDYIATKIVENGAFIPFPVMMTVSIDLTESYSTAQINSFSLKEFKNGQMNLAFKGDLARSNPAGSSSSTIPTGVQNSSSLNLNLQTDEALSKGKNALAMNYKLINDLNDHPTGSISVEQAAKNQLTVAQALQRIEKLNADNADLQKILDKTENGGT